MLEEWRSHHGSPWRMQMRSSTGRLELLYGGHAEPPFRPRSNVRQDWFDLALHWVRETRALHGIAADELQDGRFVYLPLAQTNTTDKVSVRFEQTVAGVPVERGTMNLLFDTDGRLLSLHNAAAASVADRGRRAVIDAGFSQLVAAAAFEGECGTEPRIDVPPRLLHACVDVGSLRTWQLAWLVETTSDQRGMPPIGRRYTIDAQTGAVLRSVDTVHNLDVFGTVSSYATPGLAADSASNPPAVLPMPRVHVRSSAGTVVTDRHGNFRIVGVNSPIDLIVDYSGPFTAVNNEAGSNYSVTFQGVRPNQQNSLLMNPAPDEFTTAEANAQLHINAVRDFIRDRMPNDPTADFQATAIVNRNANCNASFTGHEVNFFTSGGGCSNTAFSSVVAHEMGHWLNELYGTGNERDGMGEGNADVFAMYVHDDPVIARGFFSGGGSLRTGHNTVQFCGDESPSCHGGSHANGEVWMGAAWKVRSHLNRALGDAVGDLTADLLFLGWMNAYDQALLRSIIEIQWLVLDDNNGDLDDGTPNFRAIDAGFREQGFPGFQLPYVSIEEVSSVPNTDDEYGPYRVTATVQPGLGQVAQAAIMYTVNGGPVQRAPMSRIGGASYAGGIPGQLSPAIVRYAIEGTDTQGNTVAFPAGGPVSGPTEHAAARLEFTVGAAVPLLEANFESGAPGWRSGAPTDTATAGRWTRGDPIGTSAQPEFDTSDPGVLCWFTGQGTVGGHPAEADVDGGTTTLLSPAFDATGAAVLILSLSHWFANEQTPSSIGDDFVIGVSNDGGATWREVHRIGFAGNGSAGGWLRATYVLTPLIPPTSTMVLRFAASDSGADSVVEAAIDDVRVTALGAVNPPMGYCTSAANSTGQAGTIDLSGSRSVAQNAFTLSAAQLPPGQYGLFFFGPSRTSVPFPTGAGTLCVDGRLLRLPIVQIDPLFGTVGYSLDFEDRDTAASVVTGQSTWNFQFWFRDTVAGQPTSNATDAVSVFFYD